MHLNQAEKAAQKGEETNITSALGSATPNGWGEAVGMATWTPNKPQAEFCQC